MKLHLYFILASLFFINSCQTQNKIDQLGKEGVVLFQNGEIEKAILKFNEIIDLDNNNKEAYFRLGDCLGLQGDIYASIKNYSKAIEIDRNYKNAYYNRALEYERIGDIENTRIDYFNAVSADLKNKFEPDNKLIYHNLGILFGTQNELDKAIKAFSDAIHIDRKYADAFHNRGFAYLLKDLPEKAIEDFEQALKIDPSNVEYLNSLNKCKETLNN